MFPSSSVFPMKYKRAQLSVLHVTAEFALNINVTRQLKKLIARISAKNKTQIVINDSPRSELYLNDVHKNRRLK
jgi:hypothetical protein